MTPPLGAAAVRVLFVQGVVPLWELWRSAAVRVGRPIGDVGGCVGPVWRRGRRR